MDMFARTGGLNFPYHDRPWNLISIYGCGDAELLTPETTKVFEEMGCENFLSLDFWDITPEWIAKRNNPDEWDDATLFNKDHAHQVLSFLRKIQKEKYDSVLLAHCHALSQLLTFQGLTGVLHLSSELIPFLALVAACLHLPR